LDVTDAGEPDERAQAHQAEFGTTFILITHDIATASDLADDVAVMYAGHGGGMRQR